MVVPVWAEPLARCYSTIMVLLPTRRIFDFSTSCILWILRRLAVCQIRTYSLRLSSYFGRENGGTNASTTNMRGTCREIV